MGGDEVGSLQGQLGGCCSSPRGGGDEIPIRAVAGGAEGSGTG